MGANFCTHRIMAPNRQAAVEAAKVYQEECLHESGHGGYTGHLGTAGVGVTVLPVSFKSYEEAEAFILDEHSKWDLPCLAHIEGTNGYLLAGWCSS